MSRRSSVVICAIAASLALAAPSSAVVGGQDASPGEYPAVAEVSYGAFSCTGTLIAPTWVLTAGHCSSMTGVALGTPATWPAALIDVRIGSIEPGRGERVPVSSVVAHESYVLTDRYDISLLKLARPSVHTPAKVAGTGERDAWDPGDLETIVGFGLTEEGGDAPDVLQEAQVPITTDSYCADAYDSFHAPTMVCAGYPQGGVDTCQGDSGGPMFGTTSSGARRIVGVTSWGEGCARKGKPGVYARVGDTILREWIRARVPAAIG